MVDAADAVGALKAMYTASQTAPESEFARDVVAFIWAATGTSVESDEPNWENVDMAAVRERLRSPQGQAMMDGLAAEARLIRGGDDG